MPSHPLLRIACAVNESYLLPLSVLLESLRQHLRPDYRVALYLVHGGIDTGRLSSICSGIETHPILLSEAQLAAAPRDSHFPPEASIPLLIPELLPTDVDRVLFLDADLLVLDDLAELWETPLDGRVFAAAADGAVPFCSSARGVKNWKALGIPSTAPYFNAGVLLIDLARWREREVRRRVDTYFKTTREPVDFLHQEALNAVLWNDWKELDGRWNLLASRAGRSYESPASQAWRNPGIVHFAGRVKPWRSQVGGPFNSDYQDVLRRVLRSGSPGPTLRDRFNSVYDRYLRAAFYPLEQLLWKRRVI